jgi:membrane dipeptidase
MWMIDGHLDIAWNAVQLGRDLTLPLEAIRQAEGAVPAHGEGTATVSLPALCAADIRLVLGTLFTNPAAAGHDGYHTPEEAFQQAKAQLAYYHGLAEAGELCLIHTCADVEAIASQAHAGPGIVPLMENADPLRTPDDLPYFVERGVRIIGLSWQRSRYAGGTGHPGPLTPEGDTLLREMDRLGVALDISHLAEEAFWQALRIFRGRVIASHANCRAIVPGDRQLSDEMIRAIAERDGVIGVVLYNRFIRPDWQSGDPKEAVGLADLVRHVEHIAQVAGVRHIGIGSDLDGGVGREVVPREIDSIADLPSLADALAAAGMETDAVRAILHGNWLRILRAVVPS